MATPKQLAALAKARAARAKKLAPKKTVKKRTTKAVKKTTAKTPRKNNPSFYAVRVKTVNGQEGYLSSWGTRGPNFDDSAANAVRTDRRGAEALKNAIFTVKPKGITYVEAVIIGHTAKK